MITWNQIYDLLGIRDFIYFISSPVIQETLLPVKLVFILFTLFFLCAVIYFYMNSTYLQYQFLQDFSEFFSWQPYTIRGVNKRWKKIMKKTEAQDENGYKLAIIEADDFLYQVLEEKAGIGETFEELIDNVGRKMLPNSKEVLEAHQVRNSIVYNQDYQFNLEEAKRLLAHYETAIKSISAG